MEKVEVPYFIKLWLDKKEDLYKLSLWDLILEFEGSEEFWRYDDCIGKRYGKHDHLIAKAAMYGYYSTEPKYYVFLNDYECGYKYCFVDDLGMIDYADKLEDVVQLTEKQIKAVDERYMYFAVRVDEVSE